MATVHFEDRELECRCGCGGLPGREFQDDLEALRSEYGRPMIITSGFRCRPHNLAVSGRADGPHTLGLAVDVRARGEATLALTAVALSGGWSGIGWNQTGNDRFVHLDRLEHTTERPRPAAWSY